MVIGKRPGAAGERASECLGQASRYLSYRPRSESELRGLLAKRGFPSDEIDETVLRLKEKGLLNDLRFARLWKGSRLSLRPRSQRMIRLELEEKGVSQEIIDEATADIDDEDVAYGLALKRIQKSPQDEKWKIHLYNFLKRRGFNHETITQTIRKITTKGREIWE